ncbi:MAG: class I SAM-dependent methyltransferase [Anaerolineae bacterium]
MKHDKIRKRLRKSYALKTQERDARPIQSWKLEERSAFLSLLQQEQKHTLLEIGAGTGIDSKFFQDEGLDVVCIDLSPEMVQFCRQKGLTAQVMDIADLQFPTGSFDAVYALNCLLHLPHDELPAALNVINRVLKPNGLFFMGVYGGYEYEGIWEEDAYEPKRFFSFYSDEHLQQVVRQVFDIHSFKRITTREKASDLHFQSLILRKRVNG